MSLLSASTAKRNNVRSGVELPDSKLTRSSMAGEKSGDVLPNHWRANQRFGPC